MAPPQITTVSPQPFATDVELGADIVIEVIDPDGNLDADLVTIHVRGVLVWASDAATVASAYAVTQSAITNGYRYTINPASDHDFQPLERVTVEVIAEDLAAEQASLSYYFTARRGPYNPAEKPRAAVQDGYDLTGLNGPPNYQTGLPEAQQMPGGVDQDSSYTSRPERLNPAGAVSDEWNFDREQDGNLQVGVHYLPSIVSDDGLSTHTSQSGDVSDENNRPAEGFAQESWHVEPSEPQQGQQILTAAMLRMINSEGGNDEVGRVRPATSALLEDWLVEIATSTFMDGQVDGDGNEPLNGSDVRHVFLYDATQDPWHNPGTGFHGIARNGVMQHDGSPTGLPGTNNFGTIAGGIRKESWIDDNDPMGTLVDDTYAQLSLIADDTIRISHVSTDPSNWVSKSMLSASRWFLTGDFDVRVDFANLSGTGATDGGAMLYVVADYDNYAYVRMRPVQNNYDKDVRNNGSWGNYASVGSVDTSGTLRLTRTGDQLAMYFWNGSGWTQIGSNTTFSYGADRPVFIGVQMQRGPNATAYSCDFSNFQVVSGTVINTAGWYREPSSTTRGTRQDFPTLALIMVHENGIDIVDADTQKLWMHFSRGSGNAIRSNISSSRPQRVVMRDGVLIVAYGADDEATSTDGGVLIDFTLDEIRHLRALGSTATGALQRTRNFAALNSPAGASALEVSPHGQIYGRNFGLDINGDYDDWKTGASSSLLNCDLYEGVGQLYHAIAEVNTLRIIRWRRWYLNTDPVAGEDRNNPIGAEASESGPFVWVRFQQSNGRLFYANKSNVYDVGRSAIDFALSDDAAVGTNWVTANTVALPAGVNTKALQRELVLYDTLPNIFIGAADGIYRSAWPSAFTHFYGATGSGATHEILPADFVRVLCIGSGKDGVTPLLLFAIELSGARQQLGAINLSTNQLYGVFIPAKLKDHVTLTGAP